MQGARLQITCADQGRIARADLGKFSSILVRDRAGFVQGTTELPFYGFAAWVVLHALRLHFTCSVQLMGVKQMVRYTAKSS